MPTPAVKLDKQREIVFDFEAIVALEDKHGIDFFALNVRHFTPKQMAALVWAGQLHTPKPLEFPEVVKLLPLDPAKLQVVLVAILQAITATYGDAAKKGKEKDRSDEEEKKGE